MRPWSRAVLAALVLALLLATPVLAASETPVRGTDSASSDPSTRMVVQLQPDGDAVWTVSTTFQIESEQDREAFRELAANFERGGAEGYSVEPFRRARAAAAEATGRPMEIRNVNRNSTLANGTGRLTLRFTWTNFAAVDGDQLSVQGAFNTTSGTWLPRLAPDQTLVIRPPRGYGVTSAPPIGIRNGVVRLEGPRTLDPGYLSITYERGAGRTSPVTPPGPDLGFLPLLGAGLLAAAAVAGAYLWAQRREPDGLPGAGGVAETNGGDAVADEPSGGPEAVAAPDPEPADEEEPEPAEELLSDEERVERLLTENGGRMKQARIVKETGWSNAKVSQLLSSMDEEGRVDKLRIGRENLISLPDEDVGEFE